jgi:RND family efflux transporter MFP subunit
MKKALIIIIILLAAAAGFYYFGPVREKQAKEIEQQQANRTPTIPRVEVIEVSRRDIFRKGYKESSSLDPLEEVVIYPKVSARIAEIKVQEGDLVEKGQLLVELDHRDIDAQIASIKAQIAVSIASLESAKANYDNALKERDRYRRLVKEGFATTQQLDVKETAFAQARAQVNLNNATIQKNRSELKRQQVLLSEYFLESPLNGKVVNDYSHSVGTMVSPSTAVMHVARVDMLEAVIKAPQDRAVNFREGMKAELSVESFPGRTFYGKINTISPVVDPSTRTSTVKVVLENPDGLLKPGMFAEVFIVEKEVRDAYVIPREAVIITDDAKYVLTVSGDVVKRIDIEPGIETGQDLEVRKGLEEGDLVILSGGESLSDGDKVTVD